MYYIIRLVFVFWRLRRKWRGRIVKQHHSALRAMVCQMEIELIKRLEV